jgi:hypothetical protein
VIPEAEKMDTLTVTWDQLYELLIETLELFQEYRDQYGYDEEQAKQHAVFATLERFKLDCPLCGFALD